MDSSWDSTVTCSNEYWQCTTPAGGLLQGAAVLCSALPSEHDTNPLNSQEQARWPWACFTDTRAYRKQLWQLNFFFYVRCFRLWCSTVFPPHKHTDTHPNVSLQYSWEHHPRGLDMKREHQELFRPIRQLQPHPITTNHGLCGIPTVLTGEGTRCGQPHP